MGVERVVGREKRRRELEDVEEGRGSKDIAGMFVNWKESIGWNESSKLKNVKWNSSQLLQYPNKIRLTLSKKLADLLLEQSL